MRTIKTIATAALALAAAAAVQAAPVTATSNTAVTICDLCTVSSTITFNQHLVIGDLNASILNLTHTFDSDLVITLFAPTGRSVVLSNRNGGSGNNFINTVFDDEATTSVSNGSAPFNGSYRPNGLLSSFDGLDAFGTWTLQVSDQAALDSGTLRSWSLTVTSQADMANKALPEPGSLALVGAALGGLAMLRRRRG